VHWFYRLLTDADGGEANYLPNAFIEGKAQMWPGRGEDWITYFGISCWDREDRAIRQAQMLNPSWERRKGRPRWTHYARFRVDGHMGQAFASQGPTRGHFTAWGDPQDFYSSASSPVPIPPDE
jgi:hypothetical protein